MLYNWVIAFIILTALNSYASLCNKHQYPVLSLSENFKKKEKLFCQYGKKCCLYIDDKDSLSYGCFYTFMENLAMRGSWDAYIHYKNECIDISYKGMDWDLPVYLPNTNKIVETPKFLPETTKIENNGNRYILVKWYINGQDEIDKKKFLEYIHSISERNIGFYFIVNPDTSLTNVFDYIIQVPKKITIYGLQFGLLPTKRF